MSKSKTERRLFKIEDHAAIKTGLKLIPDFSLETAEQRATTYFQEEDAARSSAYRKKRLGLQEVLQIYLYIASDRSRQIEFAGKYKAVGFILRKGTPFESAIIRFYKRDLSDERVNCYASALREAVHRNVQPTKFAKYLAKKGQGVNALHEAWKRRKEKLAANGHTTENKATGDSSESVASGGAAGRPKKAAGSGAGARISSPVASGVTFDCTDPALKELLKLGVKTEASWRCRFRRSAANEFEILSLARRK